MREPNNSTSWNSLITNYKYLIKSWHRQQRREQKHCAHRCHQTMVRDYQHKLLLHYYFGTNIYPAGSPLRFNRQTDNPYLALGGCSFHWGMSSKRNDLSCSAHFSQSFAIRLSCLFISRWRQKHDLSVSTNIKFTVPIVRFDSIQCNHGEKSDDCLACLLSEKLLSIVSTGWWDENTTDNEGKKFIPSSTILMWYFYKKLRTSSMIQNKRKMDFTVFPLLHYSK